LLTPPTIQINGGNTVSVCNGSSVTLTATGGNSYVWNTSATSSSISVSPTIPTTYSVIGTGANGCIDSANVTVQVTTQPTANISALKDTICFGETLVLNATGGGTYLWNDNSTFDSLVVSPTLNTTYSVIVDLGGCTDTASFPVIVNPLPIPVINGNNVICDGQTLTLTASGGGAYSWSTGAVSTSISVSPTANPTTYSVIVTDANGCVDSTSTSITVNPLPIITITGNDTICNGATASLTVSGASSYVWSSGQTVAVVTVNPTNTTTYTVVGTSTDGCVDSTQFTVSVTPLPTATISGNNSVCDGATIDLTASGGTSYLWTTTETTATISVSPTDTTTFVVIVTASGCSDTASTTINWIPLPSISAYSDTAIMLGQSASIYAQGTAPFTWSPIEGLSCSTCASLTATPSTTTTYCVETTENNCINSACVTIFIDETCGEVFVPNAFSPNNDGNNDCLSVYSNCLEKILFRVYSRWGALIYETEDIEACWDGEYNGSTLNSGVYVYTVKAKLINGEEIELKGDVTLFK